MEFTDTRKINVVEGLYEKDDMTNRHRQEVWTCISDREASESEGSDDTHISATPKKRTKIATDKDEQVISCRQGSKSLRRQPFRELSGNIIINTEKERPKPVKNLSDVLEAKNLCSQSSLVKSSTKIDFKPCRQEKIIHAKDSKKLLNKGSDYSHSSLKLSTGFNINICRAGERRTEVQGKNTETLPAGFFASCAPSSFSRFGSKSSQNITEVCLSNATKTLDEANFCNTINADNMYTERLTYEGGIDAELLSGPIKSSRSCFSSNEDIANEKFLKNNLQAEDNQDETFCGKENASSGDCFEKLTVAALKKRLASRGLKVSGSKEVLVARLMESVGKSKSEKNAENQQISTPGANDCCISTPGANRRITSNRTSNLQHNEDLLQEEESLPADEKHYKGGKLLHRTIPDVKEDNQTIASRLTRRVKRISVEKEAPALSEFDQMKPLSKTDCKEDRKASEHNSGHTNETKKLDSKNIIVNNSAILQGSFSAARIKTKAEQTGKSRQIKKLPLSSRLSTSLVPINKPSKKRIESKKNFVGNFVKLNINGKNRRNKRFLNRTHTRKPAVYGRKKYHRNSWKKKDKIGDEDADNIVDVAKDVDQSGEAQITYRERKRKAITLPISQEVLEPWTSLRDGTHNPKIPSYSASQSEKGEIHMEITNSFEGNTLEDKTCTKAKAKALETPSEKNLLRVLQLIFGFDSFRSGQYNVIQRVLARQSTLAILPTGVGKSLCYQLPAYLLPGITLVVSPLLALMIDQLRHLPPRLSGAIISSAQTSKETTDILKKLHTRDVKILFISPERLFCEGFLSSIADLPEISMVVVDEAHCLSEWSHNFRPSYYRLGSVLQTTVKANCILALTATATFKTEKSILTSLSINVQNVVRDCTIRRNVFLSVSLNEKNKIKELLMLLQTHPFSEAKSIIIYCKFQAEADIICSHLQQKGILAESYHGGKTTHIRKKIQDLFCFNKLKIVVATVAFGMGLDKSDVQAVVHYSLPSSLEQYVQETGRAGRDGSPSNCHLFVDNPSYLKLRSLAYSDGVDENAVRRFLSRVFENCFAQKKPGHIKTLMIAALTRDLDIKEEVMATILSYLEVGTVQYLRVLPQLKTTCCLSFYKSSPNSLAQKNVLVAAMLKKSEVKQGQLIFDMYSLAEDLNVQFMDIHQELQSLQADGELSFELQDPAFCFSILEVPEDICSVAHAVTSQLSEAEKSKVHKLDTMYMVACAAAVAFNDLKEFRDSESIIRQETLLQTNIKTYFETSQVSLAYNGFPNVLKSSSLFLRADIKVFLRSHPHENFSARAIARIFHGLGSPAYPSANWSKNHFWGRYVDTDFHEIMEAAKSEHLGYEKRNKFVASKA